MFDKLRGRHFIRHTKKDCSITRGESEIVSCACVPLKKQKNKSVTTNKRIHPKNIHFFSVYVSFFIH